MINSSIFKAYDIRGIYSEELNEDTAYKIGQAFASYVKKSPIIVGGDSRLSSPSLKEAVIRGLNNQGIDVIDIGLCSTSCFYFTVGDLESGGGMIVTASHASKEFNGFKIVFSKNVALSKKQILDLKKMVFEDKFDSSSVRGQVIKKDSADNYIKAIRNTIKEEIKPLKIVMDPGNGMAGLYIEKVFANLGIEIIPLYFEPDGNFPNHEANPKIPENRKKLEEKIINEKADLGFMFDGDADRLYVLNREGKVIDPSLVIALISEYRILNSPRKKIITEVRASKVVRDWVERAGGNLEVIECWTIPMKLKMQSEPEIIFAGETSGHYIFPELHESDDGIMGALTFLQAISAKRESIDEINEEFEKNYFVLEETNFKMIKMEEGDKIIDKLKNKYRSEGAEISEIDGASVIFLDWWFNLRKSQSDPVIRLNLEASSKELFKEKKAEVIRLIEENI
ncbi:MAG: Phosphomannomutase [Parcubacteria group bacterium GW2011_GWF2_44_7]|nr:MAG: Phosphomannomutase [Parcubacteria group bacterium GW2011_GWF2_44_7]